MSWEILGTASGTGASATLDSGTISARNNIRVIVHANDSTAANFQIRFDSDSGNNYSTRRSYDGGSDSTFTSQTKLLSYSATSAYSSHMVLDISNMDTEETLISGHTVEVYGTGATDIPGRVEFTGKWITTSRLTSVQCVTNGSNFTTDSYITVLGSDEPQTADSIEVSGMTAKNNLWVELTKVADGAASIGFTFNSDTGSNYTWRRSVDGGADSAKTSRAFIIGEEKTTTSHSTHWISNEDGEEKLMISQFVAEIGSGATSIPSREEFVGKWTNTSQITTITCTNQVGGDLAEGTEMTVYGTD